MTLLSVIEKTPKHVHKPWVTVAIVKPADEILEAESLATNWKWIGEFPAKVKYTGWKTESGRLAMFYQLQTLFSCN